MIAPTPSFTENLENLPSIDGISRIDLIDPNGAVVSSIENQPGKKGSLAVYQYLGQCFATLDAEAAAYALRLFAEHTEDAKNRPGAHPNIDRLFAIVEGDAALTIECIAQ